MSPGLLGFRDGASSPISRTVSSYRGPQETCVAQTCVSVYFLSELWKHCTNDPSHVRFPCRHTQFSRDALSPAPR